MTTFRVEAEKLLDNVINNYGGFGGATMTASDALDALDALHRADSNHSDVVAENIYIVANSNLPATWTDPTNGNKLYNWEMVKEIIGSKSKKFKDIHPNAFTSPEAIKQHDFVATIQNRLRAEQRLRANLEKEDEG